MQIRRQFKVFRLDVFNRWTTDGDPYVTTRWNPEIFPIAMSLRGDMRVLLRHLNG